MNSKQKVKNENKNKLERFLIFNFQTIQFNHFSHPLLCVAIVCWCHLQFSIDFLDCCSIVVRWRVKGKWEKVYCWGDGKFLLFFWITNFSGIFLTTFSTIIKQQQKLYKFLCEMCWIAFISRHHSKIQFSLKLKRFIISHYDALKQFIVFDDSIFAVYFELNVTQDKVVEFSISSEGFFNALNRQ